jgi:uncharacterized delta-60 repeat protein
MWRLLGSRGGSTRQPVAHTRSGTCSCLVVTVAALAVAAVTLVAGAAAAPGDLDPSFSSDGIVRTDLGGADRAFGVAVQPDGKIVAAGCSGRDGNCFFFDGSGADFALARYNVDGSRDAGFGSRGKVLTDLGGDDGAFGVAVQSDNKIVAAGGSSGDFAVVRYNVDGSLDPTFGSGGIVLTEFGGRDVAYGVVLQADGKIVAAGDGGDHDAIALARYNVDGSLDSSFGSGGKVLTTFDESFVDAFAVVLQPDGRIVTAGRICTPCGPTEWLLVRYKADGSLDPSFGGDGIVVTFLHGFDNEAHAVAVQPDGRIVAAGGSGIPERIDFALVRYKADGSEDARVLTHLGHDDAGACAVVLQRDGRIIAGGTSGGGGYCVTYSKTAFALVRYNADLSLDSSFGTRGRVRGPGGKALAVALQPDGRIVAAGFHNADFALARYDGGGKRVPN